jgi:hypothetical protein
LDKNGVSAVAKPVRGAKFDSPNSRSKLSPSQKPYYLVVDDGLHLGYRKGERTTDRVRSAGKWVLRRYVGSKKYAVETIAAADDFSDANGRDVLSFCKLKNGPARSPRATGLQRLLMTDR